MRKASGFSLIELLIVVAIILIIAAIAIPNMLKSKISANEASAIASMRGINTAQSTYILTYPTIGYADNLTKLGNPAPGTQATSSAAGLLDWVLGCAAQPCNKSGYNFAIVNPAGTPVNSYEVTGVPQSVGQTGFRGFCSSGKQVIRYDSAGGTNCTQDIQ